MKKCWTCGKEFSTYWFWNEMCDKCKEWHDSDHNIKTEDCKNN